MLAWVFWHARFEHVAEAEYDRALAVFHERIRAAAPAGLLGLRTIRYDGVPWLETSTTVYEDWHFLADSAALDRLEAAAVAEFAGATHERVARLARGARAGLYRLCRGRPAPGVPSIRWTDKPRGQPEAAFVASLDGAAAVWRRSMVLGPTPEFGVESSAEPGAPLALPPLRA
jgi:hypothetical protein